MANAARQVTLSIDELNSLFILDPEKGILRWRIFRSSMAEAGQVVGSKSGNGYLQVKIKSRVPYLVHRVIWAMHYGEWPTGSVDHINRDVADNRIENLRMATASENSRNRKLHSTNTSGYKGVVWVARVKKWRSQIIIHGVYKHLGYFSEKQDAIDAYSAGSALYHGEFGRIS